MEQLKLSGFISRFLYAGLLLLAGICINSCVDDKFDLDPNKISHEIVYDPRVALTIGSTTFLMDSILNHLDTAAYINYTHDGLMYIDYSKDLQSFKGEDKIPIPGDANTMPMTLYNAIFGTPTFPGSGEVVFNITALLPITFLPGHTIDSINLKNMLLNVSVNSYFNQPGSIIITFLGLVKNNKYMADTFQLPASNETISKNGQGYMMKFDSAVPGISYLPFNIRYKLTGTPNSIINPLDSVLISFAASDLKYNVLYGYVGQGNLMDITDTLDLGFLNNELIKNIKWADPQMIVTMKNSYVVMPVQLINDRMDVVSKVSPTLTHITFDNSIDPANPVNPKTLKYPTQISGIALDTVKYDNSNTVPKLFDAIQNSAEYLVFRYRAESNPGGVKRQNIVIDSSSIDVKVKVHLPIYFSSSGFGTTDTMDFDLGSSLGDKDTIDAMIFRINSESTMPVDMNMQIIFADADFDTLTKTETIKIVAAGQVDNSGKVTSPSKYSSDIKFNKTQLDKMKSTKKILIHVYLNTADSKSVKFYIDSSLKLTFGCYFHGRIQRYL
jgi:hypothetical protein